MPPNTLCKTRLESIVAMFVTTTQRPSYEAASSAYVRDVEGTKNNQTIACSAHFHIRPFAAQSRQAFTKATDSKATDSSAADASAESRDTAKDAL